MPYTEAGKRAVAKYHKEHMEQFVVRCQKGLRKEIADHLDLMGESQAAFFRRAIAETIERDREKMRNAIRKE